MGSHQSGDGFTAGEINWANDITLVIAARYDQDPEKRRDFSGKQIFIAKPDDEPRQRPANLVDGVTGYGYLGGAGGVFVGCAMMVRTARARARAPGDLVSLVTAGAAI
jgi:hypothetical protein